ncbi:hypothetical protein KFK09_015191 [Dendrobium nobile]|uniref:Uncharacterized protein n=1 Tax=Dendrobium nobile TaxID=94219 RepID=A0A8T3B586_DENNO|nr:hypothetical protein KFK09_015191 [Dendrobium nobile]
MFGSVALLGLGLQASLLRLIRSFDDFPLLSDRKLRHFYRKQERELAGCEGNFLPSARFFG